MTFACRNENGVAAAAEMLKTMLTCKRTLSESLGHRKRVFRTKDYDVDRVIRRFLSWSDISLLCMNGLKCKIGHFVYLCTLIRILSMIKI